MDPLVSVPTWSGHEARALRQALRLSVRAFAEHLGVAVRTVAKWEAGGEKISPRPDSQAILDTALNKADDQAQARFAHVVREEGQTAPQPSGRPTSVPASAVSYQPPSKLLHESSGPETVTASPVVEEEASSWGGRFERGTAAAAFPALAPDELNHFGAAMDDARRYFDADVVACLQRQLKSCAANDGAYGPALTLPVVLGVVAAIDRQARQVKANVRRDLLVVGAQGAEFLGWLYRDARQPRLAAHWRDRAAEWALEANDWPMQGYMLLKKSQASWDERDGLRMRTLAQAAHDGPWQLPTLVRAETAQQEARGLAMTGEPSAAVDAKLDEAWQLFTSATPDADELGWHYDRALLTMQTAICYCEAGQPERAGKLYRDHLNYEDFSSRDRGYFLALMAGALSQASEPDGATQAGRDALKVAVETSSQRTVHELARVCDLLAPWRSQPAVREFREAVLPLSGG